MDVVKRGELRARAQATEDYALLELLDFANDLVGREVARLRDAGFPEFVPEAVTDAAYGSIADWYTPGTSEPVQSVLVPALVETIAESVYRASREVLS